MKYAFTTVIVVSAAAVVLAARTPSSAASSSHTVTLTGCLRPADTAGAFALANVHWDRGASRAIGTGGEPTLSSAEPSKDAASGAAAANETVRLIPSADVDLKAHVGQKIQVTGTLGAASGGTPGDANVPATTPAGTANPTTMSQPDSNPNVQASTGQTRTKKGNRTSGAAAGSSPRSVTVTSMKTIAQTCGT